MNLWSLIPADWAKVLPENWFQSPTAQRLAQFVAQEDQTQTIYPPVADRFNSLIHTPFDRVKVVIVGQDPYHGPGQAHGLSFSVPPGQPLPPSLRNIFKELENDLHVTPPTGGTLDFWAKQGVLLLNTSLTVRAGEAGSHQGQGWEQFTDLLLMAVAQHHAHVAFILWGSHAQKKLPLLQEGNKHLFVMSAHPSPLSAHRGFFGSRPFSRVNAWLVQHQMAPIQWTAAQTNHQPTPVKATGSVVDGTRRWKRRPGESSP